jgi:hypothetical protein
MCENLSRVGCELDIASSSHVADCAGRGVAACPPHAIDVFEPAAS